MRAVEMSPATGFIIRDSNGDAILRFEEDGNVVVAGVLTTSASSGDLTPSGSEKEFIVRNASGQVVARASTLSGNLYIKGTLTESVGSLTADPAKQEMLIRNSAGQVQSLIDENGNLKLRGLVL